jgi:serine protease Do
MSLSLAAGSISYAQHAAVASERNIPDMIQSVRESVVNVQTDRSYRYTRWRSPGFVSRFFRDFFEKKDPEAKPIQCKGEGTGVIIDSTGLVLTNEHVISGADTILVVLNDKSAISATVIGKNEKEDLALLKIETPPGLSAISLGDSDSVRPVHEVYAIGTPYGYSQTVTKGIVSAVHRELKRGDQVVYEDVIQTDASVNPGNSGGPLLNSNGEMVGMINKQDWRGQGIGFAIPINKIKKLIEDLKSFQPIYERAKKFGARFGFVPTEKKAEEGGTEVVIDRVIKNSAAWKSGLQKDDALLRIEDIYARSLEQLIEEAGKIKPGKRVYLELTRQKRKFFTYIEAKS